jgi:endo-1,4-beta-mannosidase
MSWWSQFDPSEVATDFSRIAACGFDCVRVFLSWEAFQPAPNHVDGMMLGRLVNVADLAAQSGLSLIPTLFNGHMSGVNWIPSWALGGLAGDDRFRVFAGGRIADTGLRNWYTDPVVTNAQAALAMETVAALRGHGAVWAWDLGNENSNCVTPPTAASAEEWLARTAGAIHSSDDRALITIGLHMEDLEEDRRLGPREAAGSCDFLSMHGYPIYASWAEGPLDEQLLPFLARMTR